MDTIVLRDTKDEGGRRYLGASIDENGDLVITGQDLGPGVEEAFGPGIREYEWVWTVKKGELPKLAAALGGDVMTCLARDYSGARAADLYELLDGLGIDFRTFSRHGD